MTNLFRTFAVSLAVAILILTLPILAGDGDRVKQVSPDSICFINKTHFNKPQTAVTVEGKTYYACCESCRTQLMENAKSRVDIDPVSCKEIDKSTAAVGVDKSGNAYFFENQKNLKAFRVPTQIAGSPASGCSAAH